MKHVLLLCMMTAVIVTGTFVVQVEASFTSTELIRVVYDKTTGVEEATDLGSIGTGAGQMDLTSASNLTLGSGALAFHLSDFGANVNYGDLNVAYFAVGLAADKSVWVSAGQSLPSTNGLFSPAY